MRKMRKRPHAYDFICSCKYMYDCIERGILKSKSLPIYSTIQISQLLDFVPGYIYILAAFVYIYTH